MRILFISPLPQEGVIVAGGISGWTLRVLESNEIKKNHQIQVVNTSLIGKRAKGNRKYSILEEGFRTFKILVQVITSIRKFNPDIVHLNSNCSNFGLLRDCLESILVKFFRVPLVIHLRCDVAYYSFSRFAYQALKVMAKNSNMVFILNNSSSQFFLRQFGINSIYMPLFISPKFKLCSNNYNISEEITKICFVGHVTEAKGCNLITSIARVLKEIEFLLVGQVFESFVTDDLPENLQLSGSKNLEQVKDILLNSDLFLFPSKTEGFPNAVLEAMGCGLPIVASCVGAVPDMVGQNGEGGILIDKLEVQDYIDAILELSKDREKRLSMSSRNITEVSEKYTEEKVIEQMLNKYEECIKKIPKKV